MRDRLNEIETLRRASDEYRALLAHVRRIVERNPHGLRVRPMFGQGPVQEPVRPVRKLRRAA
jgi:hypothetical protein